MKELIKNFARELKRYCISFTVERKNRRYIRNLTAQNKEIKIELGESEKRKNMEDWSTVDIGGNSDVSMDLTKKLPFPDNCATAIYSSHLFEHFSCPDPMINLLTECRRVLKTGGVFSVCVPNARIYVEMYLNPEKFNPDDFCRYKPALDFNSSIDYLNYMAYMNGHHKHLFDEKNLIAVLQKAGFKNARLREFNPLLDREERKYESIYAEAVK